jgi:hypothetical protein
MLLHITPDDKFVPFLQGIFEEAVTEKNVWRVLTDKPKPTFALLASDTEVIDCNYFSADKFKEDLQAASVVIFHSLYLPWQSKRLLLSRIPNSMPIVWRGWGYDYYDILTDLGLSLYLPETKLLVDKAKTVHTTSLLKLPRKLLRDIYYHMAERIINNRIISRVDYFSCCVPEDYESLKKVLPNFKAQFLPLNYYSVEDIFLRGENICDLTGHDILLGNSSTLTNNHIEAMRILSKLDMRGRKVVVPLSYGDMEYREEVIRVGYALLGESFVPLAGFMPLSEYNQVVSSCGNLVMNHIRQQAMGNIGAALIRGGKIFLRPENPIYRYYTRMGVKLFPFSDGLSITDLDAPLSKEDALNNKKILLNVWSRAQGVLQAKAIASLKVRNSAQ